MLARDGVRASRDGDRGTLVTKIAEGAKYGGIVGPGLGVEDGSEETSWPWLLKAAVERKLTWDFARGGDGELLVCEGARIHPYVYCISTGTAPAKNDHPFIVRSSAPHTQTHTTITTYIPYPFCPASNASLLMRSMPVQPNAFATTSQQHAGTVRDVFSARSAFLRASLHCSMIYSTLCSSYKAFIMSRRRAAVHVARRHYTTPVNSKS